MGGGGGRCGCSDGGRGYGWLIDRMIMGLVSRHAQPFRGYVKRGEDRGTKLESRTCLVEFQRGCGSWVEVKGGEGGRRGDERVVVASQGMRAAWLTCYVFHSQAVGCARDSLVTSARGEVDSGGSRGHRRGHSRRQAEYLRVRRTSRMSLVGFRVMIRRVYGWRSRVVSVVEGDRRVNVLRGGEDPPGK